MVSVFSGTSALGVIFSLVLAYWAGFARMMRALIQQFSEREFVLAHQSLGATLFQTFRVCILPNVLGPFVVYFCHRLKIFILSESAMSFLGFGYEPGTPSWGALIAQGRDSTLFAPHVLIVGSLALLSLLFAVEAVATSCENLLKSQKPG